LDYRTCDFVSIRMSGVRVNPEFCV
jgi:hypothetical protein